MSEYANRYLPEIVSEDIREINYRVPRNLCQTYCGRQVIPGKIFCYPCHSEWNGFKWIDGGLVSDELEDFVVKRRTHYLEANDLLFNQRAVWSSW